MCISKGYIYAILNNNMSYKQVQKNSYPYSEQKFKRASRELKQQIDSVNTNYTSIDETGI